MRGANKKKGKIGMVVGIDTIVRPQQPHEPDRGPVGPLPVMQALGAKGISRSNGGMLICPIPLMKGASIFDDIYIVVAVVVAGMFYSNTT
jgi:hypothetical protein